MYSKTTYPGKFEGNPSQLLAETVYHKTLDGWGESLGDVEDFGYFAYIEGKRYGFILSEDSQGFVYVDWYQKDEAAKKWQDVQDEYQGYCDAQENAN